MSETERKSSLSSVMNSPRKGLVAMKDRVVLEIRNTADTVLAAARSRICRPWIVASILLSAFSGVCGIFIFDSGYFIAGLLTFAVGLLFWYFVAVRWGLYAVRDTRLNESSSANLPCNEALKRAMARKKLDRSISRMVRLSTVLSVPTLIAIAVILAAF